MNPDGLYVRIWEFAAKPEARAEFEHFYGPDGEWVQLFRRSQAFLRTDFFRDRHNENRYITIDYFSSKAGFENFLRDFRQEYEALDRRCEGLSACEREIGTFVALSGSVLPHRA